MHSNCLSPTEKFSPFSITSESSFIGSWATCVGKNSQRTLIAAQVFLFLHGMRQTVAPPANLMLPMFQNIHHTLLAHTLLKEVVTNN